jgi:2,3-bisphosphoglycerate-independent phosphoglycerate mutase
MKRVIAVIRDGWGYSERKDHNAIAETPTPNTDRLMQNYPNVLLNTSGEAVGLPKGYQGNSEVGHMTIGSGRITMESLSRINTAITTGEFFKNKALLGAITNCKKNKSKLHIIGLLQEEGVHSHLNHLSALIDLCKKEKFTDVYLHVITDGRDAPATKSQEYLRRLNAKISSLAIGTIVTVSGRFYAMDRDKRWERTKKAYDCIVNGTTNTEFTNATDTITRSHNENVTDEFIVPRKLKGYSGIKEKDSIIFYNFRTDRTRQLTQAIVEKEFEGWKRKPLKVYYAAMTQYYTPMNAEVAFDEVKIKNNLGEVIAKHKLKQLRISETEKYAHVTFFFNSQIEVPNKGEDRVLIHSPKVETYDQKPEMSAYEVADRLVKEINSKKYNFIVVNIVNGDMVGHTGVIDAIKKAVAVVDDCTGKITDAGLANGYTLLIFADHGNAEDQSPEFLTSHTMNPVPLILVSNDEKLKNAKLKRGKGLQDIAPTVLNIMGIKKPKEMTGESLII